MAFSNHLRHFLRTKGFFHALERTGEVLWRFRDGRTKFEQRMDEFERVFQRHGVSVTFCVTTSLLSRHKDLIRRLEQSGHEIAAHGHIHTRMDQYDYDGQLRLIEKSWCELQKAGFQVTGFRCPYLNFDAQTIRILQESPYMWTSGEMIWWQDGQPVREGTKRLEGLYHFIENGGVSGLPHCDGRLIHIPITSPDDELLFERERVRDAEHLGEVWLNLFERHHQLGGLHHQFFHPERFDLIEPALERLLTRVNELGSQVWKPTLGELAEWWRSRIPNSEFRIPNSVRHASSLSCNSKPLTTQATSGQGPTGAGSKRPRFKAQGSKFNAHTADDEPGSDAGTSKPETRNPEPETIEWPNGAKSCFVLSSDICAIDLRDFIQRTMEF